MSEYLSKKALLEWLESEMSINKGHPDDIDIHWTLNRVSKKIQSGAFDADDSEVQRLRAAAIKLHETLNTYWQGDCEKADVVAVQSNLCDVLDSIGNHPKQIKPFQQRLLELTIEENKKIYNTPKGDGNNA